LKFPDKTPNLGDILVFSTLSSKYSYKDIMDAYIEEQLDRQVFWMLKEIPELDFENKKIKNLGKVDEKARIKVCFECGKTGFYLNLFFLHLNNTIQKLTASGPKQFDKLTTALDSNYGCMSSELENQFQQDLFSIIKMDDFVKYYGTLGIKLDTEK
jgi:hypothetical protein